jgi:high-affinity K+ transport system ATPase subunit B
MNHLGIQEISFLVLLLTLSFILINGTVFILNRPAFEKTFRKSLKVFSILILLVILIPIIRFCLL